MTEPLDSSHLASGRSPAASDRIPTDVRAWLVPGIGAGLAIILNLAMIGPTVVRAMPSVLKALGQAGCIPRYPNCVVFVSPLKEPS